MPTPTYRVLVWARITWFVAGVWLGWIAIVAGQGPVVAPVAVALPSGDGRGEPGWPSAIILEPPATRDALLSKLRRPDYLLWDGDRFDHWVQTRPGLPEAPSPRDRRGLVRSVAVEVRPEAGRARIRVEYGISLDRDEPTSTALGLNGLILGRVVESGRDLPVRALGESQGWGVELAGRGDHLVLVETTGAIRSGPAGSGLAMTIPPAATTRVDLIASRPLREAHAGANETLAIVAATADHQARGHLGPRSRLDLQWREREPAAEAVAPVLAARGEIALVVNQTIESREAWSVAALRGTTREVIFELEPAEEVVDVQVNRQMVTPRRRGGARPGIDELVVPLPEPIRPLGDEPQTPPTTILLSIKRPAPPPPGPGQPARFTFRGHPIAGARSQTGVIGVGRSESFLVGPREMAGIRRVDLRADRLAAVATRPEPWLGFEFTEQPFQLELAIEPNPPQYEVNAWSTIVVEANQARVTTKLTGRVWQGRLFEARVAVPPGLNYEPGERATEGMTLRSVPGRATPGDPTVAPLVAAESLVATFDRSVGPGETFTISLQGTVPVPTQGVAALGLFAIPDATIGSTEVAILAGRDRRVEWPPGHPGRFVRLDAAASPSRSDWPPGSWAAPGSGLAPTWLRSDQVESGVSVRFTACPIMLRHRSSLTLALDRQGGEVVDEIVGEVANGTVSNLVIALPPEVSDRWIAESGEGLDREAIDDDPATGWRRYRLKLAKASDAVQIRLRYRLEFAGAATGSNPLASSLRLQVQPVRVLDGHSTGQTIRLSSEPDVAIAVEAPGWTARLANPRGTSDSIQEVRRSFEHPGDVATEPVAVVATLGKLADLPTLVASRLWLRSTRQPDGELATTARYRLETHGRSIVIRLPDGSRWVRGMAGALELNAGHVEQLTPTTYRITLPSAVGAGPVQLRIDSAGVGDDPNGSWLAPELVDGVVQQSAWELSLLGNRAGVGVPEGWSDENVWVRQGLIWVRQPRRGENDLARWLADGQPTDLNRDLATSPAQVGGASPGPRSARDGAVDFASTRHSYLFSRPGPPSALRFPTFARSTLLLVCSGPVLALGLLILARRPPPRWVFGGLLSVGFVFVALVEPNTGLLVAQSAAVGFAFATLAASIQVGLAYRTRSASLTGAITVLPSPSGVSNLAAISGDSDEQTVVRSVPDAIADSTSVYLHEDPDRTTKPTDPFRRGSDSP